MENPLTYLNHHHKEKEKKERERREERMIKEMARVNRVCAVHAAEAYSKMSTPVKNP